MRSANPTNQKEPIAKVGGLLAVGLDPAAAEPLQRQLYDQLREAVLSGRLPARFRLPPTRVLAADLGVSRNTVLAAIEQLTAEGYVEGRVGAGTYVATLSADTPVSAAPAAVKPARHRLSRRATAVAAINRPHTRPRKPFGLGIPDLDGFPFEVWSRLIAKHWRHPQPDLMTARDPAGYLPLRRAIAAYLNAFRATRTTPDQVIVTAGAQAGLDLAVRVMLEPGEPVWIEDPGYAGFRAVLAAADALAVPVPVDAEGLSVEAGRRLSPKARLAFVSPSHQFPLGVTMSLGRRLELIDWAAQADAFILEDDYDSEYRYEGRPLAALQGLDGGGRVIYVGSFSKVMFPALRLGYLVVPEDLVDPFLRVRAAIDDHPSIIAQPALAEFIEGGQFAAHIRRSRKRYATRKGILEAAFAKHLAGVLSLRPIQAGLHAVADILLPGLHDTAIVDAALARGIVLTPLSSFGMKKRTQGLLFGFAGVDEKTITRTVKLLAEVIAGMRK